MTDHHPLAARAHQAPQKPGVYRFRDERGAVLYVGKARNLRRRVLSYFTRRDLPARTVKMLASASDLDFTVTATEVEALVLENTLIKRHRPRFNVMLKDDKTYPYIKVTTGETWPRVELTRRVLDDGQTYFGPFMGQYMARRLMEIIRTRFPVRTCRIEIDGTLPRPCLYHHMHACLAPCVRGMTTEAEYASAVEDVLLFLTGRTKELLARLEASMWAASDRDDFEHAAALRDLITIVRRLGEPQNVEIPGQRDADVIAAMTDGHHATVCVLPYRGGKLVDKREWHFEGIGDVSGGELVASFIAQFYEVNPAVPPVIDTAQETDPDDRAILEAFLSERRGRKVTITAPKRGPRARRVELALANARTAFELRFRAPLAQAHQLERRLGEALGLPGPVRRLECFDISHTGGKDTVASCVVWKSGRMNRKAYRSFVIRSVDGIDDFAAIAEAVGRRYRRVRNEGTPMPDLVLIDGGPGQLNAAEAALDSLGVELPAAALAKREELIYLPNISEPLRLDRSDPAHLVLRQARDEAHRFAVSHHRRRRRKHTLKSQLLDIPSIGPGRAKVLLTRFGSLRGVRNASVQDLEATLGPRLGRTVWQHLHGSSP